MAEIDSTTVSYFLKSFFLRLRLVLAIDVSVWNPTLRPFVIVYQIFDPPTPNLNNGVGFDDSVLLPQPRCYFVA